MKKTELLIQEGNYRLDGLSKSSDLSEVYMAKLLIVGGREKLTSVNEQQRQVTSELDKLRLKRKDAFPHKHQRTK